VDGIKREYRGRLNVVYVDIGRADGKERAKEYGVMGTPTLLLLDSEGKQVNVLRGSLPPQVIKQAIEDLLAQESTTSLELLPDSSQIANLAGR
jgi:thioredoxin-related protein